MWPELEAAADQVINAVIPRLLGALQADGRELKPSLIHGDCWEGTYPHCSSGLAGTNPGLLGSRQCRYLG